MMCQGRVVLAYGKDFALWEQESKKRMVSARSPCGYFCHSMYVLRQHPGLDYSGHAPWGCLAVDKVSSEKRGFGDFVFLTCRQVL